MDKSWINLQLFADGGDGGAAAGDAATGDNGQAAAAPVYELPASRRRPGMKAATPAVQTPPAAPTAAVQTEEAAPTEEQPARKTFDELIKGEYKADFDSRVQQIVKDRLKGRGDAEKSLAQYQEAFQIFGERYNVDPNDPAALIKALQDDDSLYEEAAMREGLTVDQYKTQKNLEREVERYRQEREQDFEQKRKTEFVQKLMVDADSLKASIPEFANADTEQFLTQLMGNEVIQRMVLTSNVPLKTAYYAVFHDQEMARVQQQMAAVAQQTAQTTQQRAAASIATGARRPVENGTSGSAAVTSKTPMPKTRAEFAEAKRRAQAGELLTYR